MSERVERCWDCPSRRGISRLYGKLACKFYRRAYLNDEKIEEQRNGCPGAVPAKFFSTGETTHETKGDTHVETTVRRDVYLRGCPRDLREIPEVPEHVAAAMKNNNLSVFEDERTETRTEPLEQFEQKMAGFRDKLEARRAARNLPQADA